MDDRDKRSSLRESGQVLVLFALFMMLMLGFAVLTIDVGFAFWKKRDLQNAVDAAALAAAQDMLDGKPVDEAIATAKDYLKRNGYDPEDVDFTFDVNIPPQSGPYAGDPNYVEVLGAVDAPFAFLMLFRDDPFAVNARAVSEWGEGSPSGTIGPGGGDGDDPGGGGSPPEPPAVPSVECGTPTVDGRVTDSDGYTKIGDLAGGSTDFGDAFFACDGAFLFFALRLNGPSTGGAVANENVYGPRGEKDGPPGYNETYQTGWGKHDFGALKNSDRARFQIACDGDARHDFIQDYLHEDGSGWASDASGDGEVLVAGPAASASSLEWNLEHPFETGWGDDPGEVPYVPGEKKLGQSPPFNPLYPAYDPQYGWIWEMIYEFKVPIASYSGCQGPIVFGLQNFAGQAGPLEGIHSSPPKIAEGVTLTLQDITTVIRLVE